VSLDSLSRQTKCLLGAKAQRLMAGYTPIELSNLGLAGANAIGRSLRKCAVERAVIAVTTVGRFGSRQARQRAVVLWLKWFGVLLSDIEVAFNAFTADPAIAIKQPLAGQDIGYNDTPTGPAIKQQTFTLKKQ